MTDWGFTAQIAGVGFITVFVVLGILSLVLWFMNLLFNKAVDKLRNNKKEGM